MRTARRFLLSLCLPLAACAAEARPAMPSIRPVAVACEVGTIAEVLDAGSYTYVAYRRADEAERWLVSLRADGIAAGQQRGFTRYGEQAGFRSARLGRTFEHLYFGRVGQTCP